MADPQPSEPGYEPPEITSLGSVDALTAGVVDNSTFDGSDPSDQVLKQEIVPLENALARLRLVQTR